MHVKAGDTVEVIAGDDRGAQGKVLRVLTDRGKLVVEGVNKVLKHVKPTQRNPRGGRVSKEMPIDASNVLLVNPRLGKGVRVGFKVKENGEKVRVCRKTGDELGVLRKAKSG